MLKSRITRIVAGTVGCVMAFLCAAQATSLFIKSDEFYSEEYFNKGSLYTYNDTANEAYRNLFIAGNVYLNKLNKGGEFIGNEHERKQTIAVMQDLGLMDEKGELQLVTSDKVEYRVSVNGTEYANTDKTHEELSNEYAFMLRDGNVNFGPTFHCFYDSGLVNWFTTNYGMTYYYVNGKGYAVFNFDTDGCDSYVDELGATVYYKLDGTTPIPYGYVDFSEYETEKNDVFVSNGEQEVESVTEIATLPDLSDKSFTKTEMSEDEIVITVSPKSHIISEVEQTIKKSNEFDAEIKVGFLQLAPLAAVALVMALYVLIAGGYSKKERKFVLTAGDKVFAEIYIALGVLAFLGAVCYCAEVDAIWNYFSSSKETFCIVNGAGAAAVCGILLLILNSLIIRLKCRSMLKTSITGRILIKLWEFAKKARVEFLENMVSRDMLRNDKFTRSFILRTAIALALGLIVFFVGVAIDGLELTIICWFIILAAYIYFSLADLKALQRLNEHISAVNAGDYTARNEAMDSPIYTSTEKLNNISTGIQGTVEKQLKSERMKIELVTNVSHDLKTPLTSIISYIDLLSAEELSPTARDYVTIIEGKSQRLKTMVADLFDLAKATSRTDVQTEEIDAVVLTRQVVGDLTDKIETSGRTLKCDIQAETAPINADGKKMYRVFQNVIDNALKYSMEGTRVYLTLKNENGICIITVKNIASYEMTFSPDEITERFTRGDEARSTEGNGLGLSIAKSFTEACGGSFRVDIDGDVFAAIIEMPVI